MATTAVSVPLPDDWEYIDDDTFSIISLQSEDDTPEPPRDRSIAHVESSPAGDLVQPQCESPTRNHPQSSDADKEPDIAQVVESCGTGVTSIAVDSSVPPFGGKAMTDELAVFYQVVIFLRRKLHIILSRSSSPDQAPCIDPRFKANCEFLVVQLDWILKLLVGHASQDSKAKLPVGISEWARNLETELAKVKEISNGHRVHHPVAAQECYQRIEDLRMQMDRTTNAFFNDFLKLRLPLKPASHGNSPIANEKAMERTFGFIASESNRNHWPHLRRELYKLRDSIVACLGEIHSCTHRGFYDPDQSKMMATLTLSYQNTKESLEKMLSNPAPGTNSSGPTKFLPLHAHTVSSLVRQLKQATDILWAYRTQIYVCHYKDGHREHPKLRIDAAGIDMLRMIDERLISILCIPTR